MGFRRLWRPCPSSERRIAVVFTGGSASASSCRRPTLRAFNPTRRMRRPGTEDSRCWRRHWQKSLPATSGIFVGRVQPHVLRVAAHNRSRRSTSAFTVPWPCSAARVTPATPTRVRTGPYPLSVAGALGRVGPRRRRRRPAAPATPRWSRRCRTGCSGARLLQRITSPCTRCPTTVRYYGPLSMLLSTRS